MKSDPAVPVHILLVDDNARGTSARRMILEEQGCVVRVALSGEEALESLHSAPCDVVVTDYKMGGMTGVELIRKIRASDSPARVILLSGFVNALGLNEENTGADEVIAKSNREVAELVRAVRKLAHEVPRRRLGSASARRANSRGAAGAS